LLPSTEDASRKRSEETTFSKKLYSARKPSSETMANSFQEKDICRGLASDIEMLQWNNTVCRSEEGIYTLDPCI